MFLLLQNHGHFAAGKAASPGGGSVTSSRSSLSMVCTAAVVDPAVIFRSDPNLSLSPGPFKCRALHRSVILTLAKLPLGVFQPTLPATLASTYHLLSTSILSPKLAVPLILATPARWHLPP